MYARVFDCALQTVRRMEFNRILRDQVLPDLKNEPGFVDLISFVSEEQPDHVLAIALWKTNEDAHRLYTHKEPVLDLIKPLLTHPPVVEHYNVETSIFKSAVAHKAA